MRGEEAQIARARRGRATNPMQVSDAAIEQAVARYIDNHFRQTVGDIAKIREQVSVLAGERGNGADAAMRAGPMMELLKLIPAEPKSRAGVASPTAADFAALVADVHAIYASLSAVRFLLTPR
ncbi:MAG: hypothetical protein CMJ75_19210 [Planctomycetaceae bacterium]|nr:hypothetical protein [Planctomycetaceae bacterium]